MIVSLFLEQRYLLHIGYVINNATIIVTLTSNNPNHKLEDQDYDQK